MHGIFVVILLVSSQIVVTQASSTAVPGYTLKYNRDCPYNDIAVYKGTTAKQCSEKCDQLHKYTCVAFVYRRYTRSNNCWVKKLCTSVTYKYGYSTYERNNKPGCQLTEDIGFMLYGHNDRTYFGSTLLGCKQLLMENINWCLSADFNTDKKICFLSSDSRTTAPSYFGKYNKSMYIHKNCEENIENWESGAEVGNIKGHVTQEGGQCYIKYGPVGAHGGNQFTDLDLLHHGKLSAVNLGSNGPLICVAFTYGVTKSECHGGHNSNAYGEVRLDSDEYITTITGITSFEYNHHVVSQLTIVTNKRTYDAHGRPPSQQKAPFTVNAGGKPLIFVSGSAGTLIDSLTFYFKC